MKIKESLSLFKDTVGSTFKIVRRYPVLLLPFLITAIVQACALTILFNAPRPPVSIVLAPPIRAFFGDRFLHYPDNFLLLPQLFYFVGVIILMCFGVIMFGMSMGMLYQANAKAEKIKIFGNLNRSIRRYFALVSVWIIPFVISLIILRGPRYLIFTFLKPTDPAKILFHLSFYIGVILVFIVEGFFIYTYPSIIVERKKIIGAIKNSFSVAKGALLVTVLLIAVPRVLDIGVILLKQNLIRFMNISVPEITLVILAGEIIITFITDSLVFLTTANLFIKLTKK